MRRLLRCISGITAVAMLAGALCGCSSRGKVYAFDVSGGASALKAELSFVGFKADMESLTAFESALRGFMNEHSDISVFYEGIKAPTYYDVLAKRIETHHLDDLVMLNHDTSKQLADQGRLLDLSGLEGIENFSKGALEQVQGDDGKIYTLPLSVTSYSLYVNRDLLKKHDIAVPTNMAEFSAACDYFADKGITPIIVNNYNALSTVIAAKSLMDVYRSDDPKEWARKFNTGEVDLAEKLRPGLELVETMINRKWIDCDEAKATPPTSEDLEIFVQGERPFMVSGSWATVRVKNKGCKFDYGVYPYPILDDGSVLTMEYTTMLAVSAESEYRDAAIKFAEYMISPGVVQSYCSSQMTYTPLDDSYVPDEKTIAPLAENYENGRLVITSDYNIELPVFNSLYQTAMGMLDGATADESVAKLHSLLYSGEGADKAGDK